MINSQPIELGGFSNGKELLPQRDAAGRFRTSEQFNIFDNKNTATRNRDQWSEVISGLKLGYNTLVGGPFQVAEEIRGTGELLPIADITADDGSTITADGVHNDWTVGMVITGQTSGATAIVTSTDTGSDIQHVYDLASVELKVGDGPTDYAFRQSFRYIPYSPGKGQNPTVTFIFGTSETNRVRRAGIFDDLNGLFIEQTENDVAFVIRSSTSGVAVDTRFPQDEWNLDRLDGGDSGGPNPSRKTLDLENSQLASLPFLWQGVGPVFLGLEIDNKLILVHEVKTANEQPVPYMRNPTLPLRYEIRNVGAVTGSAIMYEICSSVASEGGYILSGYEFSIAMDWNFRVIAAGSYVPILAIRLKNEFPSGKPNRRTVKFLNFQGFTETNDTLFVLRHVHGAVDIVGTWNDLGEDSAVEFSTDISALLGRPSHNVEHSYTPTSQANKPNVDVISGEFTELHGFISQNHDSTNSQMFVIYGLARTGNSDVLSHITCIELD